MQTPIRITLDVELAEDMRSDPNARKACDRILAVARTLPGWGEKSFISDVADAVGSPVHRLASLLVHWQYLGWVTLTRADLPAAMPQDKVTRSEFLYRNASFHFILV